MGSSLAWNCYEPALLEVVVDGCIAFGPMDHLYDSVPESSNVQQIWDCLLDRIEETPDQQESWLLEYLVGCLFNFEPGQKPARDRISTQHRSHMRRIADLVNAVFQSVALEISGLLQYGGLSGFGHELDYGAFLIHKSFAVASTRGSMRPFVNVGAQKEHTKVFAEDVCRFFAAGIRTRRIALLGNNPRYFDPYHFLALKLGISTTSLMNSLGMNALTDGLKDFIGSDSRAQYALQDSLSPVPHWHSQMDDAEAERTLYHPPSAHCLLTNDPYQTLAEDTFHIEHPTALPMDHLISLPPSPSFIEDQEFIDRYLKDTFGAHHPFQGDFLTYPIYSSP